MKYFKKAGTVSQRHKADDLLYDIEKLTNHQEADYYHKQLHPFSQKKGYDYETYLKLLESVKYQIETGQRERKEPQTIVATARNKVLT